MKIFLTLIALYFCNISIVCKAQKSSIDYQFIKAALLQSNIDTSNKFLLVKRTYVPILSRTNIDQYLKDLKGKIDKKSLEEIIDKSIQTSADSFKKKLLPGNAILLEEKQIDSLQNANNVNQSNKVIFHVFSVPVFNKTKRFTIIDIGMGSARLNMVGSCFLFKLINGHWVKIAHFNGWAS